MHIAKEVVTEVEDLGARESQAGFHKLGVAADVDPARLQGATVGSKEALLFVGHQVRGLAS